MGGVASIQRRPKPASSQRAGANHINLRILSSSTCIGLHLHFFQLAIYGGHLSFSISLRIRPFLLDSNRTSIPLMSAAMDSFDTMSFMNSPMPLHDVSAAEYLNMMPTFSYQDQPRALKFEDVG